MNSLTSLVVGCFGVASLNVAACSTVFAATRDSEHSNYCTPYVGLSAQREHLRFDQRFGGPLYNRSIASGSIIAGLRFSENFGLEFEYALSQRKNKIRTLTAGQVMPDLNIPLNPGEFETYKTRLALDSINLSLTGFLPLNSVSISDTALFGSLGGSLLKLKSNHILLAYEGGIPLPSMIRMTSYAFKNSYRKLVPFIKFGIERKMTDKLSLRLFSSWKKVDSFYTESTGLLIDKGHLRFSSTLGYGISVLYNF